MLSYSDFLEMFTLPVWIFTALWDFFKSVQITENVTFSNLILTLIILMIAINLWRVYSNSNNQGKE